LRQNAMPELAFFVQFFSLHFFGASFENCSTFCQIKLHDLQIVIFIYLHTTLSQPPPTTTAHTTLSATHSPPNATHAKSKIKGVKKSRQKYLFNLIRTGDGDITNTSYENIEDVQKEYFAHCDVKNFRHNFCNFAASLDLETKYSGAGQRKAGKLCVI
jgi:hypothetical protein